MVDSFLIRVSFSRVEKNEAAYSSHGLVWHLDQKYFIRFCVCYFLIEPRLNDSEAHDAGRGPGPVSAGQGARRHELGQRGQGAGLHRKAEAAHGSACKTSGPKFYQLLFLI